MLKRLLNKSDFIKNSMTLILGTVLAQLIPIGLQLFLRRMYSPEEFGLFAVYASILGILVVIANLKYDATVVIPKEDQHGNHLMIGSLFISMIYAFFIFTVFFFFKQHIIDFFKFPQEIENWLYLAPISIFLISSNRILNYWLVRKKAFKASAVNKVVRRSTEGSFQIGSGISKYSGGLIIGSIIGDFCNLIVSIFQVKRTGGSFKAVEKDQIKSQLKRYKDFPLYSAVPSLLNSASLFLPVIMVNEFYSEEITGYFDLSRQMLALPLALISLAISQVLTQKIAESKHQRKKITKFIYQITAGMGGVSLLGILIILLFGVELFSLVFGDEWAISGEFTQILIFSYAIKFIVSPLSATFVALEKIKISSIWQISYFVAICSLYYFNDLDIKEFLILYMIIDFIAYLVYYTLLIFVCKQHDKTVSLNDKA